MFSPFRSSIRKFACTAVLAVLSLSALQAEDKPDADPPPQGGKFALLVGVKQYNPTELKNLKYAEDDVTTLAKVLEESGYRTENIMLMTQARGAENGRALPLAANIKKELELLLKGRTKEDVVLVAFAGHGVQFEGGEDNFFCPMDAKLTDRETLVPLQQIYKDLEQCEAGMKVLVVDACRNDPQTDNSRSRPEVKLDSITRPPAEIPSGGVAAFYSCSTGQKAYEDADLKHGVFFYFVIEGLRGAAAREGVADIYLRDLEFYVNNGVEPFVRSKLGQSQLPQLLTKLQGTQKPLISWPKTQPAKKPGQDGAFQGIDPRYLPGAVGPTDRVNLPGYASKDHKIKRVLALRQITNHRPAEAEMYSPDLIAMSGNGEKIAYFVPKAGIFTANPDGSDAKLIVPNKPEVTGPVYRRLMCSIDGSRVYWQGNFGPIYRVNSDGSDLRQLVKEGAEYAHPRLRLWGYRIFYGTRGGIYSIDTEGVGDLQPLLTQNDLFNVFNVQGLLLGEFDVSERGTELVCKIYDPDLKKEQLFAFPVGGDPAKDLRLLVETTFAPTNITVSPDGRQVFFSEYGADSYVVNWDGTGMRKLDLPPVDPAHPIQFTNDGRWLTYTVPSGGSIITRLDGSDRVEPYQTGRWDGNNLALFHGMSPIQFSRDLRRFVYVMNFYTQQMPRQLVVGEINPEKAEGLPLATEIAFSKQLAKDPALPNHSGGIKLRLKKGAKDIERIQYTLAPYIQRSAGRWEPELGFFGLGDRLLRDDGTVGDEQSGDNLWSTNALTPTGYAVPGKYALRIAIHEKTSFRAFDKANAVIVELDGLEIK